MERLADPANHEMPELYSKKGYEMKNKFDQEKWNGYSAIFSIVVSILSVVYMIVRFSGGGR